MLKISIHALLAESDSCCFRLSNACVSISIHALLAESDYAHFGWDAGADLFLSTLSLRRATGARCQQHRHSQHFYPRSPCGERPCKSRFRNRQSDISIHALLAESDSGRRRSSQKEYQISIHALLAESDEIPARSSRIVRDFYPRSPCGERLMVCRQIILFDLFLSTLSLRRATMA